MRYLPIAIVAGLLFIPFLGSVHLLDPLETGSAEAAREMLASGNYFLVQLDFQPVYDQYPLFIWMQAGSMALLGVSEFAARFPAAVTGIITLLTLYGIGKRLAGPQLGVWWALVHAGSWLLQAGYRLGLADTIFNYLFLLSVYFAYRTGFYAKASRMAALSGICLGLAVLAKGPVAILLSLLTLLVYWVASKGKTGIRTGSLVLILFIACLPITLWLCYTGYQYGWQHAGAFLRQQVTGLPGAWYADTFYYWIWLPGCFPASIFLFSYLQGRRKRSVYKSPLPMELKGFRMWMWSLFWVVLLLWPSSLSFLPLSFLAARQVYRITDGRHVLPGWNIVLLLFTGIILGMAMAAIPLAGVYRDTLLPYITDRFLRALVQADVPWSIWETAYGLLYIILIVLSGVWLFRRRYQGGLLCLFISTMAAVQVTLLQLLPKIEAHTQRAAVSFFRSFEGKDVYIKPLRYTTYAPLFYGKKRPAAGSGYYRETWLLNGRVDRPAYFVCRNKDSEPYRHHPNLEVVGEQNGFIFFRRK
ncbi:ArnT family glycosyltransferase [Chitinophaga japonensis]|uniref:4-amino-4-deoxy-L-arabinose transferase-like glycosyltransferase n=1 Tax=Chitinophaga japonensis TaxID=104662 RepID=A0A562TFP8_CHIJA|nr:glycosyltransferase family 39 protein [Chitinophaga japonensis]TWI92352.1 4-amino-4-deoxy-L-arabinose transferase-like glycosyltransferase [Chitinophaga japonensis]